MAETDRLVSVTHAQTNLLLQNSEIQADLIRKCVRCATACVLFVMRVLIRLPSAVCVCVCVCVCVEIRNANAVANRVVTSAKNTAFSALCTKLGVPTDSVVKFAEIVNLMQNPTARTSFYNMKNQIIQVVNP